MNSKVGVMKVMFRNHREAAEFVRCISNEGGPNKAMMDMRVEYEAIKKAQAGSAACTFDLDDKTTTLAQELGLKLLLYYGATGTDLDYVFKSILGEIE
jgi:hypothetical protein